MPLAVTNFRPANFIGLGMTYRAIFTWSYQTDYNFNDSVLIELSPQQRVLQSRINETTHEFTFSFNSSETYNVFARTSNCVGSRNSSAFIFGSRLL